MRREDFTRYGRTIRVEGGLKAQSTRGAIGESWWSQRFIAVLEELALGSRLSRGRNYARAGQVLALEVNPGEVTATVQGSRPQPYEVSILLAVLSEQTWSSIESALAEQALFSAQLLAGEMPRQIEDVFAAAGASLFPTSVTQLIMHCSCPDWTVPCKHIAAIFYLLAEAFDADPFQILHWRGRDRQELLARLRTLRSPGEPARGRPVPGRPTRGRRAEGRTPGPARGQRGQPAAATPSAPAPDAPVAGAALVLADLSSPTLAGTLERFWVAPVPLPARPPTLDTEVDLLLRQLATPPAVLGGVELVTRLRQLYAALAPLSTGQAS